MWTSGLLSRGAHGRPLLRRPPSLTTGVLLDFLIRSAHKKTKSLGQLPHQNGGQANCPARVPSEEYSLVRRRKRRRRPCRAEKPSQGFSKVENRLFQREEGEGERKMPVFPCRAPVSSASLFF